MQFNLFGKYLITFGLILIILGAIFTLAHKLPFIGRLPGDIYIERKHFSFYFPLATCIILSIILTIVLNLISRR
jgi:Zn-dependent protease with chaperone function